MKFPTLFKGFNLAAVIADQFAAVHLLTADEALLQRIASMLKHKPRTWLYIHEETEYYANIVSDIKDAYPRPLLNPVIILSATDRWTLVKVDGRLLPFIYVTKGGSTRLSRMIIGKYINWLPVLENEMSNLIGSQSYVGEPPAEQVGFEDTSNIPNRIRDPKWEIGGVRF